jgi:hypothetical protein
LKLRAFGDIFASFNQKAYDELLVFEKYFVRSVIENWRETSAKSIELITRKHVAWADMMSNFSDISRLLDEEIII